MNASTAQGNGRDLDLKDALAHLEQALEILDLHKISPAVGARLVEVIELLKAFDAE